MIHMDDFGLGVVYSIEDDTGASLSAQALLDFVEGDKSRTVPSVSTFEDDSGVPIATITIEAAETGGAQEASDRRAAVAIEIPGAAPINATLAIGEDIPFGDGMRLRIDHLGYYARLSVVDDWSVYWMYGLFVIGMIAVSVSILVPYRIVHVLFDDSGPRPVLRVHAHHNRSSPEFADRVRQALSAKESE
jgi:hypothetical protein